MDERTRRASGEDGKAAVLPERTRMSAAEMDAVKMIAAFPDVLMAAEGPLRARLGRVKGGLRDLRMLIAVGTGLTDRLLETMETRQLMALAQRRGKTYVRVGVRQAAVEPEYEVVLVDDVRALAEAVQGEVCALCCKGEMERRGCGVRKALGALFADDEAMRDGCARRWIV